MVAWLGLPTGEPNSARPVPRPLRAFGRLDLQDALSCPQGGRKLPNYAVLQSTLPDFTVLLNHPEP